LITVGRGSSEVRCGPAAGSRRDARQSVCVEVHILLDCEYGSAAMKKKRTAAPPPETRAPSEMPKLSLPEQVELTKDILYIVAIAAAVSGTIRSTIIAPLTPPSGFQSAS
jgi:hypothetical protein